MASVIGWIVSVREAAAALDHECYQTPCLSDIAFLDHAIAEQAVRARYLPENASTRSPMPIDVLFHAALT